MTVFKWENFSGHACASHVGEYCC